MTYMIVRKWFGLRWKVYEVGHIDGDDTWVATFRYEWMALSFAGWRERVADAN